MLRRRGDFAKQIHFNKRTTRHQTTTGLVKLSQFLTLCEQSYTSSRLLYCKLALFQCKNLDFSNFSNFLMTLESRGQYNPEHDSRAAALSKAGPGACPPGGAQMVLLMAGKGTGGPWAGSCLQPQAVNTGFPRVMSVRRDGGLSLSLMFSFTCNIKHLLLL